MKLIPCPHRADNRNTLCICPHGKLDFRGYGIDGIDNNIIRGKIDGIRIFRQIEHGKRGYVCRGVDIGNARLHHLGLVFANSGMKRDKLTVDIRFRHGIGVDKAYRANPGTRQRFRTVRADAADTEQNHAGALQAFDRGISDKERGAYKLLFHTILRFRGHFPSFLSFPASL